MIPAFFVKPLFIHVHCNMHNPMHLHNLFKKKYLVSVSEVLKETKEVFSKHTTAIRDAVDEVLKRLVQLTYFIKKNQI